MATASIPNTTAKAADEYVEVEVAALERDPLHRRSNVDSDYIRELKDSIVSVGVIEPPVVRRKPDDPSKLLVTAGECRRRALVLGRIPRVHVIVRDLTEIDVLEVQVHENTKRRNLHPMDEAELYEQLAQRGRTSEQIADRFGIPAESVRRRLKLCSLGKRARELYVSGSLSDFAALAVAKIPNAEIQDKAAQEMSREGVSDEQVGEMFARRYWLPMTQAPWALNDAALDAEAGACVQCPKRSIVQRDLFAADLYARAGVGKKDDFCLDPACWRRKLDLHYVAVKAEAEGAGREVLAPQAAATLFHEFGTPGERRKLRTADYVDADAPSAIDTDKTWADLVGSDEGVVIARDPDGMPRRLYPAKVARAAQRKTSRSGKVADHAAAERRASRDKDKIAQVETVALIAACVDAAKTCPVNALVTALVPAALVGLGAAAETVRQRRGADDVAELEKEAKGVPAARGILAEILLTEAADQEDVEPGEVPEVVLRVAKILDVDLKEVRRATRKGAAS